MIFALWVQRVRQENARRPLFLRLALASLAVVAVTITVWPAKAAVQLAYFTATASTSAVQLEWATLSEYNLAGFEILCKKLEEPETAYHFIGEIDALGGPDQGVTYQFNVTTGLVAGERYCFRLREITTDGEPSEEFDLCGYGLGLTPAPSPVPAGQEPVPLIPAAQISPTPTAVQVEPVDTVVPIPTTSVVTPTPVAESPLPTPEVEQPESPLVAPSETPSQARVAGDAISAASITTPVATPDSSTATATATAAAEALALAQPTLQPSPTHTPLPSPTPPPVQQPPDPLPPSEPTNTPSPEAVALAQVAPTPIYLIVTATPTATPDRSLAAVPLFTPLPTVTPTPVYGDLAQWLAPTSQNLMLLLLCFTFFGASSLGLMGLITSVIYMRSRSRRTRYEDDYALRVIRRRL